MDERAARGYEQGAEPYRRARPGYPEPAFETLLRALDLGVGKHVVELGAGTGICTRQLVDHGLRVTAVEPVESMRSRLLASVDVQVLSGTAERTGLPGGVADAVVAATAWHWFDAARALDEVRRLLRPDTSGGLGLLWNNYDESVPWVAEFAAIAYRRRPSDQPSARDGRWRERFESLTGWTALEEAHFSHPWSTAPRGLVDRMLSSSAIANLDEPERERTRQEVWDVLAAHGLAAGPDVVLPYRTSVYWTRPV